MSDKPRECERRQQPHSPGPVARQPERHEGGRRRARDQGVPDGGRPGRLIRLREELGGGQLDHFDGSGGGGRGEGVRSDLVREVGDAVVGDEMSIWKISFSLVVWGPMLRMDLATLLPNCRWRAQEQRTRE